MKFTKLPEGTFKEMQMNAGILLDGFTPATGEIKNILGATSGGITFTAIPTYSDFGEDIDNCPTNMKELKNLNSWEAKMAGIFITVSTNLAKTLVSVADIDSEDSTHVIPRNKLERTDFEDIWWVGDYSDLNGEQNGGFCAVHLMNALSTGGFQIQSTDSGKGQFTFEFLGHYSLDNPEQVSFEIFVKTGETEGISEVETIEGE